MNYEITHITKYSYSEAVPVCHNLVHLTPRILSFQSCEQCGLMIHPQPNEISHRTDFFGNRVTYFSIDQAHKGLKVTATSKVTVSPRDPTNNHPSCPWEEIVSQVQNAKSADRLEAFQYATPSPSISRFEFLENYARESFTKARPIVDAVMDLTKRINEDFTYDRRATTIQTPIEEVFENRQGVCQDFSQLQIGCLRALGVPARYVSGYLRTLPPAGKPRLIGADASHAWLSVYCGDAGWIDVDPTNNVVVSCDHVTVAWGREYSDVCPIQGVIVGGGEHTMHVSVDVAPVDAHGIAVS